MLFWYFVTAVISCHFPIVGIILVSPFVVFGLIFLIGGIIYNIKLNKEMKSWRNRP